MKNSNKDIVIIGGGVVGTAIAYELSKDKSLSIAIVDIKKPGNATQASAGGLWAIGESVGLGCGVIFFKTLSKQRQEAQGGQIEVQRPHQLPPFFFDFCLRSNEMFPQLAEELKDIGGVDFKLEKTGLKFMMYDDDDKAYAQNIYDSIPHLKDQMAWMDREELLKEEPYANKNATGALTFLKDDQVNPYLLMNSFREAARVQGVEIIHAEVKDIVTEGGKVVGVKTSRGNIACNTVINSAGAWAKQIGEMVDVSLPITPVKGQILLTEKMPKILTSCFSTSDCYIAQKDNGEILIGSTTEDKGFDVTNSFGQLKGLAEGAVKAFPILKNMNCKRSWTGLRPGTPDEVPILGKVSNVDGYINACGHFRTGILTSAITSKMINDIVHDREPELDITPFLLNRFDGAEVKGYTIETV
ncbi:NAD(P)/FAD-dependent oxidoreductase [Aureivirga marina]|uniref:NAD(P)/FAD-dependent oxidoreductase n=1 Tax=Aureivirga marina TaxID=1182451 RepID=UPI0018CBDA15|nr:FAD-dependent oxidoreductase [Aureivirga marina]